MYRRMFLGTLAGSLLAASLFVAAQQAQQIPGIRVVVPAGPASPTEPNFGAFRRASRELVINLKTAKALGLTIPQSILLRADQVIE